MRRFDAVIVGGGAMGTAAARSLAARGGQVLVLERFVLGHANGSSGGPTRNVRLTYHDPVYVRMAREALDAWRVLEADAGVELLRVVGGLDVGDATELSAAALDAAGERFDRPTAEEVAERWPMLRFRPGSRFLYQSEGAVVRADEVLRAQARLALEGGAELLERTTVTSIADRDDGVEVTTADGEAFRAPAAIVAAGAWAGPLLRDVRLDLPLRPTLEQSTYFDAGTTEPIPTVIDWDTDPRRPPYLVPDPFRPGEVKAGAHLSGPVVDPDDRSFEPDPEREARTATWVGERLRTGPRLVRTETCLYTTTPDEDFVIDRVGPVVVLSPCTGHGFKFTPLIGEIAADLVTGAAVSVPLDRFRAHRASLRR
jgi:sarcosine oxidase